MREKLGAVSPYTPHCAPHVKLTNTGYRRSPFGTEEFGLVLDRPSDASPQEKELLGLVGS